MTLKKILLVTAAILLTGLLLLSAFFWKRDLTLKELKPRYANHASRFLEMQGMPVHYRDEGPASDSLYPIVLLHGTGASLHTWEGWVQRLQDNHRIIRLDLPAYGLTGPNEPGDYSLDYYAGFLLDFLDRLEVDTFVLGGNSLGGAVAWRTALEAPQRIKALILVDAAGYSTKSKSRPLAFRLAEVPGLRQLFKHITPRAVIEQSVKNVYADKSLVTDSLVDRYYDLARRTGNRGAFLDRMRTSHRFNNLSEHLSSLEVPTLILWGAEDELIPPAAAYQFHQDLPQDTLVVVEGLGHVPMEEAPEKTTAIVEQFLHLLYKESKKNIFEPPPFPSPTH